jgi:predicted 3-demethylubiquinone-9 3-methyltransferase (glyoxalase superfamily)
VFGEVAVVADDDFPGGDPRDPAATGTLVMEFTVLGQKVMGMNAGPHFPQTPAFSFYVRCADQAEVDAYWDGLIAEGGEESQCGWLQDPWGVSWQIVPEALERLSARPRPRRGTARAAGDARDDEDHRGRPRSGVPRGGPAVIDVASGRH